MQLWRRRDAGACSTPAAAVRASSKSSAFFPGLVPLPCDQMFSPSSLRQGPGQRRDSSRLPRTWTAAGGRGQGTLYSVLPWPCPSSQRSFLSILPAPVESWQRQKQREAEPSVGQCVGQCVGQGVVASGLGLEEMLEPFGGCCNVWGDAGASGEILEYLGGCCTFWGEDAGMFGQMLECLQRHWSICCGCAGVFGGMLEHWRDVGVLGVNY